MRVHCNVFFYLILYLVCFSVFDVKGQKRSSVDTGGETIADTVYMKMESDAVSVCIDSAVWLRCPSQYADKDILYYKWTNDVTGEVLDTRDIRVSPRQTTRYKLEIVYVKTTQELISNGDFQNGRNDFYTEYVYATGSTNIALWDEGLYKLASNANTYHTNFSNLYDHTYGDKRGMMMVINGDPVHGKIVWRQDIQHINPGQQYAFSAWAATISNGLQPQLKFAINGVQLGEVFKPPYKAGWQRFYLFWTAGSATEARISLVDLETGGDGNDFVLDDVSFAPVVTVVGETEVRILPRLSLNKLGAICKDDGWPVVYGTGITAYEWKKIGTGWTSTEERPDLTALGGNVTGQYSCKVTGYCGSIKDTFDILPMLKIIDFQETVSVCNNSSLTLSVQADGKELGYRWESSDGRLLSNISSYYMARARTGTYHCSVTSLCGDADLQVVVDNDPAWAEVPRDTVVCGGTPVTWKVRTSLSGDQITWTLPNGMKQTGDSLVATIAGIYKYAARGCGVELVGDVVLKLHPFPDKLEFLQDTVLLCEREPFHVGISFNDMGLNYMWTKSGEFYSSDTSVTIPEVLPGDAGMYVLSMTDACGIVQKDSVYLGLYQAPELIVPKSGLTVCPGDSVLFFAGIKGDAERYEWSRGISLVDSLKLEDVSAADSGWYRCRVFGYCGEEQVAERHLRVLALPVITGISALDTLLEEGVDYRIGVVATGDSLLYSWTQNGHLSKGNDTYIQFSPVDYPDSGRYEVRVGNRCASVTAFSGIRTKWSLEPGESMEFCNGIDTLFKVGTANEAGLHFAWFQDGIPVGGASTSTMNLNRVTHADDGVFRCVVTGRGWKDSVDYTIRVMDSLEVVRFGGPFFLCVGESGEMFVNATGEAVEYIWSGGNGGWRVTGDSLYRNPAVGLGDAGNYFCRLISRCGEDVADYSLKVEGKISFTEVPENTVVCKGENVSWKAEINSESGIVRWWTPGGREHVGKTFQLTNVNKNDAGTYRYRGESACDTTEIYTVGLGVHPYLEVLTLPEHRINVCENGTVDLFCPLIDPGLRFDWSFKGQSLTTEPVLSLRNVTAADTGMYVVRLTDACNLSQYDSVYLSLYRRLKITASEPLVSVCPGETAGFAVVAEGDHLKYLWTEKGLVSPVYSIPEAKAEDSGSYHCYVSDACTDTTLVWWLVVRPEPHVSLDLPPLSGYCADSLILSGGMPEGGVFRVNGMITNVLYFRDSVKDYRVNYNYKDVAGCSSSAEKLIHRDAPPAIRLQNEAEVASCQSVMLVIEDMTAGTLSWQGELEKLDLTDVRYPVFSPSGTKKKEMRYVALLTDQYGCTVSDSVLVRIIPAPAVRIMPDTTAGTCQDVLLTGEYEGENVAEIRWYPEKEVRRMPDGSVYAVNLQPGLNIRRAEVTDRYGCLATAEVRITAEKLDLPEGQEACENENLKVDNSAYFSYVWEDGYSGPVRILNVPGEYRLVLEDRYHCSGEIVYTVHSLPEFIMRDTFIFEKQTIRFTPEFKDMSYGPYRVEWWNGRVGDWSDEVGKEGSYEVKISDNIGCTASDSVHLSVRKRGLIAPEAFLPESGGENSRFYLKEVNFVGKFEMFIYNRWGELVYRTGEIGFNGGWNGTFKGGDCLAGVYLWVAYSEGKILGRGNVLLVR